MIAAPIYYAEPTEVKYWEDEIITSAYVEYMKPKRNLVANEKDYQCMFFVYNTGEPSDINEERNNISYYKIIQTVKEFEIDEEIDMQREQAQDEVRVFANFQDDWDGYGAIRPLSECLNHALDIIRNKDISLDYLTDIYPNPNGTLTLEWEQDDKEIGLEVGSCEFSYFAHFGEIHSYNNRKKYDADEINKLAGYISFLR